MASNLHTVDISTIGLLSSNGAGADKSTTNLASTKRSSQSFAANLEKEVKSRNQRSTRLAEDAFDGKRKAQTKTSKSSDAGAFATDKSNRLSQRHAADTHDDVESSRRHVRDSHNDVDDADKSEGSRVQAEGSRKRAEGSHDLADGSHDLAEGSRNRAEGSRNRAEGSHSDRHSCDDEKHSQAASVDEKSRIFSAEALVADGNSDQDADDGIDNSDYQRGLSVSASNPSAITASGSTATSNIDGATLTGSITPISGATAASKSSIVPMTVNPAIIPNSAQADIATKASPPESEKPSPLAALGNPDKAANPDKNPQLLQRMAIDGNALADSGQRQASNPFSHHENASSNTRQFYSAMEQATLSQQQVVKSNGENFFNALHKATRVQTSANTQLEALASEIEATTKPMSANTSHSSGDMLTAISSPSKLDSQIDASNPAARLFAQINERVGQGQWQQDLSQRINMMLNHQIQHAQIQLHPKHLGAMEISVSMGHDQQVNVSFQVQHAHVKDALDAALPRLREMLQSQGFNLNHSDISQQQQQSDEHASHSQRSAGGLSHVDRDYDFDDSDSVQQLSLQLPSSGNLDLFV